MDQFFGDISDDFEDEDDHGFVFDDDSGSFSAESSESSDGDYFVIHPQKPPVTFQAFSPTIFEEFDLNNDDGFIFALLAIEGFCEWRVSHFDEFLNCHRLAIILQCVVIMLQNPVSSRFRMFTKLFLFVECCSIWADVATHYLHKDALIVPASKKDVRLASNACDKISDYFECSKATMHRFSLDPDYYHIFVHPHSFAACLSSADDFLTARSGWSTYFDLISITLFSYYYSIKNHIFSEDFFIQPPFVADCVRVDEEERGKDEVEVVVRSVKVGKNARKKLAKASAQVK